MSDVREPADTPRALDDAGDLSDAGMEFDAELHDAEAEADDELGR